VHLLVTEHYIYQNARCNNKKIFLPYLALDVDFKVIYLKQEIVARVHSLSNSVPYLTTMESSSTILGNNHCGSMDYALYSVKIK